MVQLTNFTWKIIALKGKFCFPVRFDTPPSSCPTRFITGIQSAHWNKEKRRKKQYYSLSRETCTDKKQQKTKTKTKKNNANKSTPRVYNLSGYWPFFTSFGMSLPIPIVKDKEFPFYRIPLSRIIIAFPPLTSVTGVRIRAVSGCHDDVTSAHA